MRPGAVRVAAPESPRQQRANQTMPGAQAGNSSDQRAWREVAKGRIGQAPAVDGHGREDLATLAGATAAATASTPDDRTVDTLTTYGTADPRRSGPMPNRPAPTNVRQQPPQGMYHPQPRQPQPNTYQQAPRQPQRPPPPQDNEAPVARTVEEDDDLEKRLEARVLAEAEQIARNLRNALLENTGKFFYLLTQSRKQTLFFPCEYE